METIKEYKQLSETEAIALCIPEDEFDLVWRHRGEGYTRTKDYSLDKFKNLYEFEMYISSNWFKKQIIKWK